MGDRIFGLETEYGTSSDFLIRDCDEDRHFDYVASRLQEYIKMHSASGFLGNGGKIYHEIDMASNRDGYVERCGCPEYSTPETRSIKELIAHQRAGDRIIREALGKKVKVYKNNVSAFWQYYGSHENYSISKVYRGILSDVIKLLKPFLLSRQVFAGAGKYLKDENDIWRFRISNKGGYLNAVKYKEPHSSTCERLHLNFSDSNMSDTSVFLRFGTTSLVLDLMEKGICPEFDVIKIFPHGFEWLGKDYKLICSFETSKGTMSAIDIQRLYLDLAKRHCEDKEGVIGIWEETLDALEREPLSVRDIDWVAKVHAVESAVEGGWPEDDMDLLDLQYHDLDPNVGLFYSMERSGFIRCLVKEEDIKRAMKTPPQNTRAKGRGEAVSKYRGKESFKAGWDYFETDGVYAALGDPFCAEPELISEL